jgi:thiol-disulfide isomerase/thioredoxin
MILMIEVENKESFTEELNKNERVLALFYATWCPHCMRFVPAFKKKVTTFTGAEVVHVIIDDYDNPMWDDYEIDAVPTVILFEKGKIAKRLDGKFGVGLNEKQLVVWLEELTASKPTK